ncbi:MAG: orotidine-5'-phosphate decarboxylase [Chloroflexi bacterium]|nr:orotidine-5'-phosphate decarboxylase [Chloroflexota bacterium]
MTFWERLEQSICAHESLLCVGLDPRRDRLQGYRSVADLNKAVIDATADVACAYKPNIAFYEALGMAGLEALRETLDYIPREIPVILDAKRNDIAETAQAYAQAMFDVWKADAVTVNPYLGRDGIAPFLAYADRGVFILCKTSNPSAGDLQDLPSRGVPIYRHVARLATQWAEGRPIGLVAGATYPSALEAIRQEAPEAWLLVPGVGTQGGELEAVLRAGLRPDGRGMIINASRSIMYAEDPAAEARRLRDAINALREAIFQASPAPRDPLERERHEIARGLFEAQCLCFGDFILHSGAHSPVYVDLRRLVTYPSLLERVARVYARLLESLAYDRLAAIPYAGLPIGTAVSLQVNKPLIYPRREAKEYGTRRQIEGEFHAGETVVLLDDLITTGGSKIEAIEPLLAAGLVVRDVVVLIDREQGGAQDLARRGYRLHAALTLRGLVDALADDGLLDATDAQRVRAYLAGGER